MNVSDCALVVPHHAIQRKTAYPLGACAFNWKFVRRTAVDLHGTIIRKQRGNTDEGIIGPVWRNTHISPNPGTIVVNKIGGECVMKVTGIAMGCQRELFEIVEATDAGRLGLGLRQS